jgi:cell wall-associated NlpC family hydrolase
MSHWSEKYLGIKYKWGSKKLSEGSDCLRLVEAVLKNEKHYIIKEDDVKEDWYKDHPSILIDRAVRHGKLITGINNLREFDVVFFKLEGCVDHVGIMTDNYGRFLHQMIKRPSRIESISKPIWRDKFFTGIRVTFN